MRKFFRLIISLSILAAAIWVTYAIWIMFKDTAEQVTNHSPTQLAIDKKLAKEKRALKNIRFDLVDPGLAPPEIKSMVERGFHLMQHTPELLPDYALSSLSCVNCHFGGGITTGGSEGGISLAGVAATYPKFNPKAGRVEDLAMRVNSCFENSLNGKPLPLDSEDMQAIVTYLHWISDKYPIYGGAPWLGLKPLKSDHQPNQIQGRVLYQKYCSACHMNNGEGQVQDTGTSIPPIWGDHSFNTAAGMNDPQTFSSFTYYNMPYDNPDLTPEEALDITAYVLSQPRPKK